MKAVIEIFRKPHPNSEITRDFSRTKATRSLIGKPVTSWRKNDEKKVSINDLEYRNRCIFITLEVALILRSRTVNAMMFPGNYKTYGGKVRTVCTDENSLIHARNIIITSNFIEKKLMYS